MTSNNRVLYVDDEEANRFIFRVAFEDEFSIVTASGGEEALEILEREDIAVVVTDQRMPGISGDALMARVREQWPSIIRIIVTAFADLQLILRAVNTGLVARYVVKPWDAEEVRRMLRWGVQAHQLSNEALGAALQARLLESERLASLGAVQASLLHELAAPLSYIYGGAHELGILTKHSDRLRTLLKADETEDCSELLQLLADAPVILSDLETGASLLVHLRDEAQRLIGDQQLSGEGSCTGAELRRAVDFVLAVNRRDALEQDVTLRADVPNEVPDLALTPEDLMLVLINLTRNAIQAFSSKAPQNEVIVRVAPQDSGTIAISVSDNGEGMTKDIASNIGRQFMSGRPQGMGLGVFKCRSLVEGAGGTLTYESEPSVGTTAELILPASPTA